MQQQIFNRYRQALKKSRKQKIREEFSQSSCRYASPFADPKAILILIDHSKKVFPSPAIHFYVMFDTMQL